MLAHTILFPKGGKFRMGMSGKITIQPGDTLSGLIYPYLVEGKRCPFEVFDLVLADGRRIFLIPYARVTFLLEEEMV